MIATEKKRRAIARDYHFTKLTNYEIKEKYNIGPTSAYRIAEQYPMASVYEPKKFQLLKFSPDQHQKAILILKEHGIVFEETTANFELLEFYESSINS